MQTSTAVGKVKQSAKTRKKALDFRGMKVGSYARQGDIYVHRVDKREDVYKVVTFKRLIDERILDKDAVKRLIRKAKRGEKALTWQLAPGNTRGSRHTIREDGQCEVFAPHKEAGVLEGPTIEAIGEWTLLHPTHAQHLYGPGTYVVTYQLDSRTLSRVKD